MLNAAGEAPRRSAHRSEWLPIQRLALPSPLERDAGRGLKNGFRAERGAFGVILDMEYPRFGLIGSTPSIGC